MTQTTEFKVGDIVTCVRPNVRSLTLGKDYVVKDVEFDLGDQWVTVEVNDNGFSGDYFARRFELKTKAEDTQTKQDKTMNQFIETKTVIKTVIDGSLPNCARISVKPTTDGWIELVIGADFEDRRASLFSKKSLLDLAKTLTEIAEALED